MGAGREVLSCKEVDFGVRAISADYQKRQTEPVSIYPDRVKSRGRNGGASRFAYINEIPGFRNSLRYNPITGPWVEPSTLSFRGHSLLYKFNLALLRDPELRRDSGMMDWIRDPESGLLFELTPDPYRLSWEGRCDIWAAWSIDPEVRQALDRNGNAVVCHDVPFTRGELKELVTVLYSRSDIERRLKLKGIFEGASGVYGAAFEDANLALVKLGAFGEKSDFSPERLLDLATEAKSTGRNLIFDMDPGDEVWNHPVESMADLTILDPALPHAVEPGMKHYSAAGPNAVILREKLFSLETALISSARTGRQASQPLLCEAGEILGEPCPGGPLWLSDQVELLRRYQRVGLERGLLVYSGAPVERHAIVVQYGTEGAFARNEDEPSRIKVLEYTRIGADSYWSPRSGRLSVICENGSGAGEPGRDDRNSLFRGQSIPEMCARMKEGSPGADRNLFLGSLPPGKIEVFRAVPNTGETLRLRAYRSFHRLLERCQGAGSAAQFQRDFDLTLSRSGVSQSRVEFLLKRFKEEQSFLDPSYFRNRVRSKLSDGWAPGFQELLNGLSAD